MDKYKRISHIVEYGHLIKVVQKNNLCYILAFIRQMRERHTLKLFREILELRNIKINRIADIYKVNGLHYPYLLLNNGLKENDLNILHREFYYYVRKYKERIDYSNQN